MSAVKAVIEDISGCVGVRIATTEENEVQITIACKSAYEARVLWEDITSRLDRGEGLLLGPIV